MNLQPAGTLQHWMNLSTSIIRQVCKTVRLDYNLKCQCLLFKTSKSNPRFDRILVDWTALISNYLKCYEIRKLDNSELLYVGQLSQKHPFKQIRYMCINTVTKKLSLFKPTMCTFMIYFLNALKMWKILINKKYLSCFINKHSMEFEILHYL